MRSAPTVLVRTLAREDDAAFSRFVARVPEGERRFLKERLDDAVEAFATFLEDRNARRLVALDAGEIVGMAGAFRNAGWSAHVAELRVLVSATHRRRGVGRALARAALIEALNLGCSIAYVEVVA